MSYELFSGPELTVVYELVRRFREDLEARNREVVRLQNLLDKIADNFELQKCPGCLEYQLDDEILEICDECSECNVCTGGALVCDHCDSQRCVHCSCDCP